MRTPRMLSKVLTGGAVGLGVLTNGGAAAHAAPLPTGVLTPILTCVTASSNGTYTAHFGYTDTISGNTAIAAGSTSPANYFTPGGTAPGQPSLFVQGSYPDFVLVTAPNSTSITWSLGTGVSTATVGSVPCAPPVLPETPFAVALPASALGIIGASTFILRRRRRDTVLAE